MKSLNEEDDHSTLEPKVDAKSDQSKWYHVDPSMMASKSSYFFQNAKDACYLPYMILFLSNIGLTAAQAGTINGLRFLGFLIGAPLWGILADLRKKHSIIIFILCVTAMTLMTSQPFFSMSMGGKSYCEVEVDATTSIGNTSIHHHHTMKGKGGGGSANSTSMDNSNNTPSDSSSKLFTSMFAINILISCFDGSTQGFVDAGVMQKISESSKNIQFSHQRMFGAVGFGIGAFASSMAVEYLTSSDLPCYTPVFIVYGTLLLCLTLSTCFLFKDLSFGKEPPNNAARISTSNMPNVSSITSLLHNETVGRQLFRTVYKFSALFFLFTVFVVGTIQAVYISFLFVLLRQLHCPNIVMGLSIVVGAVASALGIRLTEMLITKLGGTLPVLLLGVLSWAVRFLLFWTLKNPWLVLPIQLLQGPGYGLFIAVSVVHIKQISSSDIYTSMYGIFNGLFFGAGAVVGNVVGGWVLMHYGIRTLCLGTSVTGFMWSAIMAVYICVQRWMR